METTTPCLGCGTRLNLEDTGCPVCLRPRSKQEILRVYARRRDEEAWQRRKPFVMIVILLAIGGAGSLLYAGRGMISSGAARVRSGISGFFEEISDPRKLTGGYGDTGGAAASPPPSIAPPPPAPPSVASPLPLHPPPAAAAAARKSRASDLPLPPMPPEQWALRGRVYDLRTLRPVPNVSLTIKSANQDQLFAEQSFLTDAEGRYLVVLSRLQVETQGYEIVVMDQRYAQAAQYEADIPYARLPADERRRLVQSAQSGDSHATPLTDIVGESSIRRDLFLSPRR